MGIAISLTTGTECKTNVAYDRFADRVESLLNSRGCSKSWLAKELGISRQSLNYVLKHSEKPKFVSELALIFNVNPKWLETGSGKVYIKPEIFLESLSLYKLSEILSHDTISNAEAIDKILFNNEIGNLYFAVLFDEYPSMATQFDKNAILIFDQNLIPKNGSYVLAKTKKEGIIFRRFYKEKGTIVLKPSDDHYNSIQCEHCEIFGTLVETRIKF